MPWNGGISSRLDEKCLVFKGFLTGLLGREEEGVFYDDDSAARGSGNWKAGTLVGQDRTAPPPVMVEEWVFAWETVRLH